jgi:hypothetical protein
MNVFFYKQQNKTQNHMTLFYHVLTKQKHLHIQPYDALKSIKIGCQKT